VSYGRYGRTRRIAPNVPVEELENVFLNDEALSNLIELPVSEPKGS
jgi:hypothetical protein